MCAAASRNKAKKQSAPVEKRRFDREACRLKITYAVLSAKQTTPFEQGVAFSRNLSEAGVSILVDHEILTPSLVQLNFSIPMRPFHMLILAKAVQCQWSEEVGLYEVGLKFVGILSEEFKQLMVQYAEAAESVN